MFETCVDQLVKITLVNQTVKTEFYNGTLFVRSITQDQADQVADVLRSKELGKIIVSPIGNTGEFAFDFA